MPRLSSTLQSTLELMTLEGHQSDKLTDEDISHQSTLNCHQSTPKLTVAEADCHTSTITFHARL
jgi:hypothetical protein